MLKQIASKTGLISSFTVLLPEILQSLKQLKKKHTPVSEKDSSPSEGQASSTHTCNCVLTDLVIAD